MVATKNVAWQAGNWWINSHSVGIENEGFALDPSYFTRQLYHSLARLTRYTAPSATASRSTASTSSATTRCRGRPRRSRPGCTGIPGRTSTGRASWRSSARRSTAPKGDKTARIVTIDPKLQDEPAGRHRVRLARARIRCRRSPTNFLYLHTAPSESAPLVADPFLAGMGATCAQDWGDKAVTGQSFAVAERAGDWLAIWYGGRRRGSTTRRARTRSPAAARSSPRRPASRRSRSTGAHIRRACRRRRSATRSRPARRTSRSDLVGADYYSASTYNAPETYSRDRSDEQFYEISFNHRIAFVKATDVDTVS